MVRELLRKMNDKQLKPHVDTLLNASSILFQQKNDKGKIYSLHEPHVECISKLADYWVGGMKSLPNEASAEGCRAV
jgi:hypothetical protein